MHLIDRHVGSKCCSFEWSFSCKSCLPTTLHLIFISCNRHGQMKLSFLASAAPASWWMWNDVNLQRHRFQSVMLKGFPWTLHNFTRAEWESASWVSVLFFHFGNCCQKLFKLCLSELLYKLCTGFEGQMWSSNRTVLYEMFMRLTLHNIKIYISSTMRIMV